MTETRDQATREPGVQENVSGGYHVPGPGGGLIHTDDAAVAQVAAEEMGGFYDDYDPKTHNPSKCYLDVSMCPGCSAAVNDW